MSCTHQNSSVIDTRKTKKGTIRRRQCLDCGVKFSTIETFIESKSQKPKPTVSKKVTKETKEKKEIKKECGMWSGLVR